MARQTLHARSDNPSLGILLMLLAYLCFTGIDVSSGWLTREAGMAPMQAAFVRYLGHLMIVSALFMPLYGSGLWRTDRLGDEVLRAASLLVSTVCNFTAIKYLPLSLTAAVFFSAPILVCALSIPLLGERVGRRRWTAIVIGFLGVLWIVWPRQGVSLGGGDAPSWAILFSLGAALSAAVYGIWTRKLAGVDGTNTQQFYVAMVATLGVAPLAFSEWAWPQDPKTWAAFLLIGFFGWFGHQVLTIAHRYAPASILAPFIYVQIIYLTVGDYVVFGVVPDPAIAPGAAIVLAAGLYIWLRERQLSSEC